MNMRVMSHYGISVVINVRLYDSQDELKTGAHKKICPEFYIFYPFTPRKLRKAKYQANISEEFRERRTGALEFMADRIII